jgi:hypothetical protein
MKHEVGQWVWSFSEDIFTSSAYDTKEEAIEDAKKECDHLESFFVGQVAPVDIHTGVDVEHIFSIIGDRAYDQVGEVAADYLYDVERHHAEILEERLNYVVYKWMTEFDYKPSFFKVTNLERVEL